MAPAADRVNSLPAALRGGSPATAACERLEESLARALKQLVVEREDIQQDVVLLEGREEFAVDQLELLRPRSPASTDSEEEANLLQAIHAKEAEQARLRQDCEELEASISERHGESCQEAHLARLAHLEAWLGAPCEEPEVVEAHPSDPQAQGPKPPLAVAMPILSPRSRQSTPVLRDATPPVPPILSPRSRQSTPALRDATPPVPRAPPVPRPPLPPREPILSLRTADSKVHATPPVPRTLARSGRSAAIGAPAAVPWDNSTNIVRPGKEDGARTGAKGVTERSDGAVMPCHRQRRPSDQPQRTSDQPQRTIAPGSPQRTQPASTQKLLKESTPVRESPAKVQVEDSQDNECTVQ